ncbi:MAG TPA: helix-turn-helix domain-containing protein [Pyrinomonadaceae bacterium]|nr:helix-turn-helix domain-containing protein [Pyrinomonadaceae bacterium]
MTADERAVLRCEAASELIQGGQYEAAREALGELWRGIGVRPEVSGLGRSAAAEVLLRAGILSGWLGESEQARGSQASAKDLISESASLFEGAGDREKAAFARSDLALCYWREGAYDEARILLTQASGELDGADDERRAVVLLRWGTVERSAGRLHSALAVLKEAERALRDNDSHVLRGSFHNTHGMTLRRLAETDGEGDYYDRAIIEFTAAVYHFERARHDRFAASIENNLAFLLNKLGRHRDAHEHLDRAGVMLARVGDTGRLAQVDATRAQVLLAERRYRDAARVVAGSVSALEEGGEAALLAEAMTVQGVVWARLGNYEGSINVLRRAVSLAEEAGAVSDAGRAALTLIEEHGARRAISADELHDLYWRADRLLKDAQNAEDVARLRACARVVIRRLTGVQLREKNFTLFSAVHEFEAKFIAQALEESGGSVTRAARLLGIRHQTLTSMLETRHRGLSKKRTPVKKRLRSIIKKDA